MSSSVLTGLAAHPVVRDPVAGGVSTPPPAAVRAPGLDGGLGFPAAGHRAPEEMAGETQQVRGLTQGAFGVHLFVAQAAAAAAVTAALAGDPRAMALWAGQRHRPARPTPAGRPAGPPPAGPETARDLLSARSAR